MFSLCIILGPLERLLLDLFQNRPGPRVVGLYGLFRALEDGVDALARNKVVQQWIPHFSCALWIHIFAVYFFEFLMNFTQFISIAGMSRLYHGPELINILSFISTRWQTVHQRVQSTYCYVQTYVQLVYQRVQARVSDPEFEVKVWEAVDLTLVFACGSLLEFHIAEFLYAKFGVKPLGF